MASGVSSANSDVVPVRHEYTDQSQAGETWVATTRGGTRRTGRFQDALHRETSIVDPDQPLPAASPRRTFWDAVNKRVTVDRRGHEARYTYDAANRLLTATEQAPGEPTYAQTVAYRDAQREEESTDRSGIPTVTTRDGLGRATLLERGAPSLRTTEGATYDGNGNVATRTDANEHVTSVSYDGANRVLTETRAYGTPDAATTRFTWDKVGNRMTAKGPRGAWTFDEKTTYDDLSRPVRTEDALGKVTTRAFDGAGNRLCEKRPLGGDPLLGGPSSVTGKTVAQLQAAVCAGEYLSRFSYDAESKLTSVVDAQQGEHSFVYDGVRNLVAKQDANGSLTTYAYDLMDRRTDEWQHLDAHERIRSLAAVPPGGSETVADPAGGTGSLHWRVSYDGAGNPTRVTDPRGVEVVRTYGLLNRLETETYPPAATFNPQYPWLTGVTYEYTGNGALAKRTETKRTASDATVTEVHDPEYDALERLWKETRYDGKVTEYAYDLKGNRTKVTDPDLVETTYTFDALDRLETATTPEGTTTYQYLPDGLLQKTTMPNTVSEGRCYDAAGHLKTIVSGKGSVDENACTAASLLSRFDYTFDANGNRLSQVERRTAVGGSSAGPSETSTYGYDPLDRLIGVKYPDGTATLYRLDPVGNRSGERKTLASKVLALTVAAFAAVSPADASSDLTNTFNRVDWLTQQTDAVDASRNAVLGYDLAGSLTTKTKATGTRTFAWDARGALASVSEGSAELGRYDYDASGMRVKRKAASETVEYVLDDGHVLQEADGSVAEHPAYRRYHYGYGPLAVVDNAGKRFIQTDALGSPTDLTSTSGAIASIRRYDAWGQYRNDSAPTASDEKLGYTGHQYDPETGLVYARARYYDPEVGAFISRDTYEGKVEDAPSLHRFAYAQANPLRYTDPTGHLQNEAQIQDQVDKAWETYHAAEEGSPERAQALQRYQYWRGSLKSSQDNKLFGEMISFPAAKAAIIGAVAGPFAWGRAVLGIAGIVSGTQKLDEARQKTGMQRTMAISEGLGQIAGGALLYRSGVAEIKAPTSAATAEVSPASTVVEGEGAAVGEASTVKVAEPQVGAAKVQRMTADAPTGAPQGPGAPEPAPEYGPFFRAESPVNQARIIESGHVGGQAARNTYSANAPEAKAWVGPLPEGAEGLEFFTFVKPASGTPPFRALWRLDQPGVVPGTIGAEDAAFIPVRVTKTSIAKPPVSEGAPSVGPTPTTKQEVK